jgi:hypothetical protein
MPGCDCDSVITLGFRHVPSRIFLRQVTVTDAQFTYRDIPVGYEYPIDPTMPFYDNLAGTYMEYDEDLEEEIEKRYYFGTSGTDLPFNRICLEHLKFVDDDDEEPTVPAQTPAPTSINIPTGIPVALADLMRANSVSEDEIRQAVSQKGYFPIDTPITSYPNDFIEGCLIAAWEQVFQIIKSNRPF